MAWLPYILMLIEPTLHARIMCLCILDSEGPVVLHKNTNATPKDLAKAIKPFCDDLVVAGERMFTWYWVADFCEDNNIPFVLRVCPLHESHSWRQGEEL